MNKQLKYLLVGLTLLLVNLSCIAYSKVKSRMDHSKFNIGAYYLKPYARTEAHIKDVADCGIDFIVNINYDKNTLDLLHKYHIGAIITGAVPSWWGGDGKNAGKLNLNIPLDRYDKSAKSFIDHPAIWGLDIGDEPSALDFPYYNKIWNRVKKLFPNHFPYLNLYPNYASVSKNTAKQTINQLGTTTYKEYIEQYCKNVTASDYICYDFYLYSINVPRAYNNLITVSDAAKQYNKSMWIVLQVNSNDKSKWISENELRFQAYTAMAFGVQNIIWGCYTAGWWYNQVLDDKGNKTQQYDKLKAVNAEIHHLSIPYMKYKRVSTTFVDFKGTKWQNGVSTQSVGEYNDNIIYNLQSADNSPILVEKLLSRKGKKREAVFICTADDPYDESSKTHTICFKTNKRVVVTSVDKQYTLKKRKDKDYKVQMPSNRGMLIELL